MMNIAIFAIGGGVFIAVLLILIVRGGSK